MTRLFGSFQPKASYTISVTTSSARVAIPHDNGDSIRLFVEAAGSTVFYQLGGSSVTAATSGIANHPIAPGNTELFSLHSTDTNIAAICASGTATLRITVGVIT